MTNLEEKLLKHLSDLHVAFRSQHNHKEISAWAGIIFFSLICLEITKFVEYSCDQQRIIATLSLIVLFALFFAFVKKQYKLQFDAGNINAACMSLTAKIISGKRKITENDCEPAPNYDCLKKIKNWHVLPKCLLEEMNVMPKDHNKDRRFLENGGYFFLIAIFLLTLYSISIV